MNNCTTCGRPTGDGQTIWSFDPMRDEPRYKPNARAWADAVFNDFTRVSHSRPDLIVVNVVGFGSAYYDALTERFRHSGLSQVCDRIIAYHPAMNHAEVTS